MSKNNFDFLRFFLAFSVVWHHFNILTSNEYRFFIFDIIDSNIAVKSFFVISGLLIWMSANRSRTFNGYVVKRFFRLYPALFFILFCSSIVFYAFYNQSISEIFKYFSWNFILLNFMHPCVGDVFETNVLCAVNGSLWTLKLEVAYYIFVGVTVFLFKKHSFNLVLLFTIMSFIIETVLFFLPPSLSAYTDLLYNQIPSKFYYFGLGVIVYKYNELISTSKFLLALSFGFFGLFILNFEFFFLPVFVVSFVFLIAFRTPLIDFSKLGDVSYGLYIYHFPLIQLFVYNSWLTDNFYLDFIILISLLLILSRFSWLYIERVSIRLGNNLISR